MKIVERNGARSFWSLHMYRRLKRRHRHAHVRGIRRDAMFACTQDCERTIVAGDRWTPTAGLALVAGHGRITEVDTTCALQQVAAERRHISDLRRGAVQSRLR